MLYKITYLINSDYCELRPDDPKCHIEQRIESNSKVEAVQELHRICGMVSEQNQRALHSKNILPIVWEIVEVIEI